MKDKLSAINYIRILCTFWILIFHDRIHYGFKTGITILDEFISIGAVAVTGFFMLSGFSLRFNYREICIAKKCEFVNYIKRRLAGIYPVYIFLVLCALIFHYRIGDGEIVKVLPIQIVLLQILIYPSLNVYLFNDNCWYLSALFVLYLLFPFFNEILREISTKRKVILCFALSFCSWYIYYLNMMPENSNAYLFYYCNPLFRIPEFMVGMLAADLVNECKIKKTGKLAILGVVATILAFMGCHFLYSRWQILYNLYNIIIIPYFAVLLFVAGKSNGILNKIASSKIINYVTGLGLTIYLCQSLTIMTLEKVTINGNPQIIFIILTIIFAILVHEIIEKPFKKILKRKIGT